MLECVKSSRYVWIGSDNAIKIVNARSKAKECFKDVLGFKDQDLGKGARSDGKLGDGGLGG